MEPLVLASHSCFWRERMRRAKPFLRGLLFQILSEPYRFPSSTSGYAMTEDEFTNVMKSLAEDLRLPAITQRCTQFEIRTGTGLHLVLDFILPATLQLSCTQSCAGQDNAEFLWNILQANLIADQDPIIVNSGSYSDSLIISWMRIGLSVHDRLAVFSHTERFICHVEALRRWIDAFKKNSKVATSSINLSPAMKNFV